MSPDPRTFVSVALRARAALPLCAEQCAAWRLCAALCPIDSYALTYFMSNYPSVAPRCAIKSFYDCQAVRSPRRLDSFLGIRRASPDLIAAAREFSSRSFLVSPISLFLSLSLAQSCAENRCSSAPRQTSVITPRIIVYLTFLFSPP